jgi:hypothetical protein
MSECLFNKDLCDERHKRVDDLRADVRDMRTELGEKIQAIGEAIASITTEVKAIRSQIGRSATRPPDANSGLAGAVRAIPPWVWVALLSLLGVGGGYLGRGAIEPNQTLAQDAAHETPRSERIAP